MVIVEWGGVAKELPLKPITEKMGQVKTTVVLTNLWDHGLASRGALPPDEVRSLTLHDVLVDTGATLLALPSDLIRQLGLDFIRPVEVRTANGIIHSGIYSGVRIKIEGREGTFECLELPGVPRPLLGVVPMEVLGLEPDLKNQRLKVLSDSDEDTYLLAM